jgi:hypothetical protein
MKNILRHLWDSEHMEPTNLGVIATLLFTIVLAIVIVHFRQLYYGVINSHQILKLW